MTEFHRLDAVADANFLRARVADPLTQTPFRPTNSVVLCRTCGLVSLRETWEAVGGCPNGHQTSATWDPAVALGRGDGAALPPPVAPRTRPAAPPPATNRWRTPLIAALAVIGLGVAGLVAFGALQNDDEPVVVEQEVTPTEPTGPAAISLTETGVTNGALTEDDFADDDGRYQDLYTFAADSSGKVLSFTVSSDDFFPDLVVQAPDGESIEAITVESDDEDGPRVVRVENARGPGLYRILITSRLPAASGSYSLRTRQENPTRPLRAGASATSVELGAFSEVADGFFRDRYPFTGVEGREHTVTVRSSAFAPTIQVTGPGGVVNGQTGRAGGVVTYVFTPSQGGTFTALVSSQSRAQKGAYQIQLAVEEAPEPEPEPNSDVAIAGRLRPNATVSDSLAAGASKAYTVAGRIGDRVFLEVRTDGFTPSLVLVGPDGVRRAASPDGDRARVEYVLPSAGTYRVIVGATDGSGGYRVLLEQQAAVTADDIPRTPGADTPRESRGQDEGEGTRGNPPSPDGDAPRDPRP